MKTVMEWCTCCVIFIKLILLVMCSPISLKQQEINSTCTGEINFKGLNRTRLSEILKTSVDDIQSAVKASHAIVRSEGVHISDKMVKSLRRKTVENFPVSLIDTTNLHITDILVADYQNLKTIAMAFENMSRNAANCSSGVQEIESFRKVARKVNTTLCHMYIFLRHQNFNKPIMVSDMPTVPVQTCSFDDSERQKANFRIVDAALNYKPAFYNISLEG